MFLTLFYYRPKRSFGQGNIFTPVCHSFCSQGGGGLLQIFVGGRGVCSKFGGGVVSAPIFLGGVFAPIFRGGVCSKFSGGWCLLQIFRGVCSKFLGGVCSKFGGVSAPIFQGGVCSNFGGVCSKFSRGGGVCSKFSGGSAPNFRGVCSKFWGGLLQILGGSPIFGIRSTFGRYASYWNAFLLGINWYLSSNRVDDSTCGPEQYSPCKTLDWTLDRFSNRIVGKKLFSLFTDVNLLINQELVVSFLFCHISM